MIMALGSWSVPPSGKSIVGCCWAFCGHPPFGFNLESPAGFKNRPRGPELENDSCCILEKVLLLVRHICNILGLGTRLQEGKGFKVPLSLDTRAGLYLVFVGFRNVLLLNFIQVIEGKIL